MTWRIVTSRPGAYCYAVYDELDRLLAVYSAERHEDIPFTAARVLTKITEPV